MEMMVVIPLEAYNAMLDKCDTSRAEYALLKNGVIVRNSEGKEQVEIICDANKAKQIVNFAATDCPELSPFINIISPAEPNLV
jgi:hypothetical protein